MILPLVVSVHLLWITSSGQSSNGGEAADHRRRGDCCHGSLLEHRCFGLPWKDHQVRVLLFPNLFRDWVFVVVCFL